MAILHDEDTRFKGLEKKIGFFVIVAFLGIVLTIIAVGIQQDLFSPKTRLFIITDSGQDISEGMAVKLRGFIIGKVEKLELTDDARVRVTLSILRSHMKWVKSDSKARLLKEGVIGANIIEITLGSEKEKPLEHNALIAFERERGLGQVVGDLYSEVVPLIDDMKHVVNRVDNLLAGMPATLDKMDSALTSANKSFANLEKMTATDLPVLTRRGRETLDSAKKVVDSVSRTWPISSNIKEPRPETLPVDSYAPDQVPKQK